MISRRFTSAAGALGMSACFVAASSTHGAMVELTASGTISSVGGTWFAPLNTVAMGDSWSFNIVIDTAAPQFFVGSNIRAFGPAIVSASYIVDGIELTSLFDNGFPAGGPAANNSVLRNLTSFDDWTATLNGDADAGQAQLELLGALIDSTGSLFAGANDTSTIPTSLPTDLTAADFDVARLQVVDNISGALMEGSASEFSIRTLDANVIPLPTPLGLGLAGLGLVACGRRRR